MEGWYGGPFCRSGVKRLWFVGGLLGLGGLDGAVVARVDLGCQWVVRGMAVMLVWAGIDRLGGWVDVVRADAALGSGGV